MSLPKARFRVGEDNGDSWSEKYSKLQSVGDDIELLGEISGAAWGGDDDICSLRKPWRKVYRPQL